MKLGLGLGLTSMRRRRGGFTFTSLFTSGSGFCYPLYPGTLWQDAAGTLPVTAYGQQVGFAQDASKGLALGPEFVAAGWVNATWGTFSSADGGFTASKDAAGGTDAAYSSTTFPVVLGRWYEITINVLSTTLVDYAVMLSSGTNSRSTAALLSGAGVKKAYVQANVLPGSFSVAVYTTRVGVIHVSSVSVREVLGNHATQPGTASIRPTYKTGPTRLSFDGSDDRLVSTLKPTPSGTIACRFQTSTAGRVMIGSQGATDGRAYLGIGADGRLAAGIGAAGMTTITGGTDIRGTGWRSGAVTWNGSTVKLYLDGAEVYSGAQSGAANTAVPMAIGALNNADGTQNSFFLGDILANPIALDYAATPAQIAQMHQAWSNQT